MSGRLSIAWTNDFLLCRMDALALGAAIAILVRGPLPEHTLRWASLAFILAASAVVGVCIIRRTVDHGDPAIATGGFSLIALANGALLLLALRKGGWIESLLSVRILRIFGKYSYCMYLYDFPLLCFSGLEENSSLLARIPMGSGRPSSWHSVWL